MTHEVVRKVAELAPQFRAQAAENERLGRLSDESVRLVREAGVMRMLQPPEHGGMAAHPRDFAEAVMAVAAECASTGWVCGVGGVHPWEFALMDPQLQEEVWGEDQDTWIASPYSPSGIAIPVDGGYRLSGSWPFSSGTDACDWVVLGAWLGNPDGSMVQPPTGLHVALPRPDYTIDDESWQVFGLKGTGSKTVVLDEAFIPAYRTIDAALVMQGEVAAEKAGRTETVYKLPFWSAFPLGITASVVGMAEGALARHLEYQQNRTAAVGGVVKENPYVLYSIGEAMAEINASRLQLIDGISRAYDKLERGESISIEERSRIRLNQVRCAWRAVDAMDEIMTRSGGNAARLDNDLQRLWRDAHVGLQHAIHVPGVVYHNAALIALGAPDEAMMARAFI